MKSRFALIVEDEKNVALVFSKASEMADFATNIIHDGQDAAEQLLVITPNIVVLDLHLSGVSGKYILRQIRTDRRLAETKVIVVTADREQADALQQDADAILIKPISLRQLIQLATYLCPP